MRKGKWYAVAEGSVTATCTTEPLLDGSGVKVLCGGDSVGVVLNGKDGKDGEQGLPGEKGDKGVAGDDGADGSSGSAGKDGVDGTDGKDGKDGAPGADGKDGIDGKDGAPMAWAARWRLSTSTRCGSSAGLIRPFFM